MLKVKSPMATSILRVGRTAGLSLVDEYLTAANGWRYPLMGGTRERHFVGTSSKPRKLLENAPIPQRPLHQGMSEAHVSQHKQCCF